MARSGEEQTETIRPEFNPGNRSVLAYNLLHMLRQFYLLGEEVKRSMEWLIKRLIKVGATVVYNGRRWQVHVASAFPLSRVLPSCFRLRIKTFWLTKFPRVKYARKGKKRGFSIYVTGVLWLSGLLADHRRAYSV